MAAASRSLVAACLVSLIAVAAVPAGLAHGGRVAVEGTLRTWHGDTLTAPVSAGAGIDTTVAGPAGLSATVARGRKVDLRWGAAADDVGVTGYRVLRGGVQVAQVTSLSYRDAPGRGTFTYTVVAVDAAGRVSPPSNAVTVHT